MDMSIKNLRLHAVSKLNGDPFVELLLNVVDAEPALTGRELLGDVVTQSLAHPKTNVQFDVLHRYRPNTDLCLKALFCIAVQSSSLAKLPASTTLHLSSPDCSPMLYQHCLVQGCAYPGRDETKQYKRFTREPKLYSIGRLVDKCLYPFGVNNAIYDQLLYVDSSISRNAYRKSASPGAN